MPRVKGRLRIVRSLAVVLLFVLSAMCGSPAQAPAQISDFTVDAATVYVACPAAEGLYYALLHGGGVSSATSTVGVTLSGDLGLVEFLHEPAAATVASCGFYAILAVPLTAPMDMDGDGIDDVFELGLEFLDPLHPDDADADADLDGVCNLLEYRQGRDLSSSAVPGTIDNVGLQIFSPLAW